MHYARPQHGSEVTEDERSYVGEVQQTCLPVLQQPTLAAAAGAGTGAPVLACERPEQVLDLVASACRGVGLTLGEDVHLVLDCAAHRLMDYVSG